MKKLLAIVLLIIAAQLQAQVRISDVEARATAEQFVLQQGERAKHTLTLSEEIKSETSGQTNLFVFAIEPKGYVIVSALNEVLAYSLNSTLPTSDELPDHIDYWLDLYNEQTEYLLAHPDQIQQPVKQQRSVGPLLTSAWGQGCFYNEACPVNTSGPCQHVEAGCVAIAMAQIMYYHKQPIVGNGSMSYPCSPYGTLSADFGQTTYQWEQMADTLHESNPAVAQLIYHCGVSVQMKYGAHSSFSSSGSAANAFQNFFGYHVTFLSKANYTDEEWTTIIRNDLDRQLPVYYRGFSNLGGHAFVCDGYDTNGLFHFNFGWDGDADGYYSIDSPNGFSTTQAIICNLCQAQDGPINPDEHGIIYVSPDGTGDGSSWAQATSDLQSAILKSHSGDYSIWVKEGSYSGISKDGYSYSIVGSCRLYGGFEGNETYDYDLSLRNLNEHPSIMDGSHLRGVINVSTEYGNSVLIDGFTIQNGRASYGGGITLNGRTHIRNCKFLNNYATANGGGLSQQSPNNSGSVVVENCEFFGNEAKNKGGGVYCLSFGSPSQFTNCSFSNNMAKKGGGIATDEQVPTLWNCLINNNTAKTGGGCYLENDANLFNCTIVKNEAQTDYGGVYVSSSQGLINNCIIWGNISPDGNTQIGPTETYSYCAIGGDASEKDSNYNADEDNDGASPMFYVRFQNADVAAGIAGQGGDWRLQPNSLCINRGINIANPPTTDLDGNPRLLHGNIDLGAYESDVATHFINAYYCEDEPYYYQDSLLSELGSYTFLFPSHPYDSLLVIQMQTPPPSVFLTEEICENETYDFFGTLLNESGQYTTTENCITYKLKLTVKPLNIISMKEEICEGHTYNFFGELLHEAGHYSAIVDCKQYELDLTINPTPGSTVIMEEEICEGESYDFFGSNLLYAGYYSTMVDCIIYNLYLTINPNPLPEVHCSNDTIVEYGNLVKLYAYGADSYLWSTGDTTQSITVSPKTDQTYTVRGFSKDGCSNTASVTVRVSNEIDDLALYPNPANNKVEIYMPLIDEVEVFNLLGTQMERVKAERKVVELDTSAYPSGVYVVHIRQLNNHTYAKLIIQH